MQAADLIAIAESARPQCPQGGFGEVTVPARDGWRVTFFYDAGDLDYISHFTTPTGHTVDFWEWPEDRAGRAELMSWCGGDNRARM